MSAISYKKFIEKRPWYVSFRNAKRRCIDVNHRSYKWYGGKGIEFLLTEEEIKFLWFRDKAWLLENPQLDRMEEEKNYCLDNCQFIPKLDNVAKRNSKNSVKQVDVEESVEWTD